MNLKKIWIWRRQLALLGESALLGDALSPAAMAEDLYNLAFLER